MPDTEEERPDEDDSDDPVDEIFRIIRKYYEGTPKREDEGMGAE